jgi:hypothetical protein
MKVLDAGYIDYGYAQGAWKPTPLSTDGLSPQAKDFVQNVIEQKYSMYALATGYQAFNADDSFIVLDRSAIKIWIA